MAFSKQKNDAGKPYHERELRMSAKARQLYLDELQKSDEPIDEPLEAVKCVGLEYLKQKRVIPIGKLINVGKPFFLKYPDMTDTTYNVYTFVGPMGSGKSTIVRSMIFFQKLLEPGCINIIFDPMKMEFSKLTLKVDTPGKREHLLNDTLRDPETGEMINIVVEPAKLEVFHLLPRFALIREAWDQSSMGYRQGYDKTSIEIMKKDGGFVFAEDISRLSEEQVFNALNYRELRADQAVHYYLRASIAICDSRHGKGQWFVQNIIDILREGVKKYRSLEEVDDEDFSEGKEDKTGLSATELQLIEQLEKYKDAGFFVNNDDERKRYVVDFRKFLRISKIINISFMGFKKTEKVGEDFVRGQTDLLLERLIEISNEYYDAKRKREQALPVDEWEQYLLDNWKVSLWFEESEIFLPRDCPVQNIKKWPCIKRLDYLMSFGRKYGFKNFGFITQRITKVHPVVFQESNKLFLGSMIGEDRDQILSDFGVNKIRFRMMDKKGQIKDIAIRDIVTTLGKEKHEWVVIDKEYRSIAAIQAFDSPVG